MANKAPTEIPASAIPIWTDGSRIFASVGGHIMAFPLAEGGIGKVLMLIKAKPVTYTTSRPLPDERGERAKAMLRKLGAIG